MRVSVIMPAYNGERFIAESIRSVLGQSFRDLELVVVDDGSTDGTREVVHALQAVDDRVVYLFQPNGKQGRARNRGIRHARGELIAFLDQDDLWVEDKLARQISVLASDPVDLVFSSGFYFYDDAVTDESNRLDTLAGRWDGDQMFRLLFVANRIAVLSVLVRRETVLRVGLMTEAPSRQGCDDYDLWMRLAAGGASFRGLSEPLVRYRLHAGQSSRLMSTSTKLAAELHVVEQYSDTLLVDKADRNARLRSLYQRLTDALIEEQKPGEAKRWLLEWARRDHGGLVPLFHAAVLQLWPSRYRRIRGLERRIGGLIEGARALGTRASRSFVAPPH